mgnify:CR=1 FL=1
MPPSIDPTPLVAAALRAPSGDNCQPFRYRWDGVHLDVVHIPARTGHVLDSGHHASRLTLGMVAESLVLAGRAVGVHADVALLPAVPGGAWLRATLSRTDVQRDALVDGLIARHTDRRCFTGGAPTDALLAGCKQDEREGVRVCWTSPHALKGWLSAADAALWRAPRVAQDALAWVRFDEQALNRRRDGVSWRNLGLPPALAAGVAVYQRLPWTLRAGALLGGPALTGAMLRRQLASSAAIVTISTSNDHPNTLVAAGRVAWRVWARLNLGGWGVQPMSMGPILSMATRDGTLPSAIPIRVGRDMLSRVPALRSKLDLEAGDFPVFMLRTGRSEPLDERLRPPRRPLQDVLEWAATR